MSVVSQIGIVILIGFIILVLIRSNKMLSKAAEEGEHFQDEWQDHQKKKEERKKAKKEKKSGRDSEEAESAQEAKEEEEPQGKVPVPRSQKTKVYERKTAPVQAIREEPEPAGEEPAAEVSGGSSGVCTLIQMENHHPVRRIEVKTFPFTVGRAENNSLVLNDLGVAREHCLITEEAGKFLLKDRGTANKIFTEGRTYEEVVLYNGQRFYIGNEEFMAEIQEDDASDQMSSRDLEG